MADDLGVYLTSKIQDKDIDPNNSSDTKYNILFF